MMEPYISFIVLSLALLSLGLHIAKHPRVKKLGGLGIFLGIFAVVFQTGMVKFFEVKAPIMVAISAGLAVIGFIIIIMEKSP